MKDAWFWGAPWLTFNLFPILVALSSSRGDADRSLKLASLVVVRCQPWISTTAPKIGDFNNCAEDRRRYQPVRRVVQAATCYPDNSLGGDHDSSSDSFRVELAVGCGWPVLDSQCPRSRPEPHGGRRVACASYPAAAHPGGDVCAFVVAIAAGGAAHKTFRSRSSSHSRSGGCAGRSRHFADDLGAAASRPLLERQG